MDLHSSTFFIILLLLRSITGDNSGVEYDPQHAIALNCGFLHNSTAIDGRQWVGEADSASIISFHGDASKSVLPSSLHSLDPTPYMTARASRSSFAYTFNVGSGYKFIRLHFYPASYSSFKRAAAFFTVRSGPYTLLNNFSAFLPVHSLSLKSIVKEFTLYVPDNGQPLSISFFPLRDINPSHETFAFVNGIEVVPMPPGLYYTMEDGEGDGDAEPKGRFHLDQDTAMEMAYRLNVGGIKLSSVHDPNMFREWNDDSNHITESSVFPITFTNRIKYTNSSKDGAPQRLYQSSWSMNRNLQDGEGVSFTWKLPVDSGFWYLIRLHFCELDYDIKKIGEKEFIILINNQIVEPKGDLIKWGGEIGVAIHKDYLTKIRGDRIMSKRDLVVALYPSNDLQSSEFIDSVLKGIEVFKLSNPDDDNLAREDPFLSHPRASTKPILRLPTTSINVIIIFIIILFVFIVHQLREEKEMSWSKNPSLIEDDLCPRFSFAEIVIATNNFDKGLEIGRGGFGKVYKGVIKDKVKIMTVAIKRLDSESKQGKKEFISEIEILSKLRHKHLVSLKGYCNDGREMILVYEYMECGTLADHLYKNNHNVSSNGHATPLTWKERVNICFGAARGLEYLHNNCEQEVIHRDVKSNNILLDEKWVAKIADFGICKVGGLTSHTHISTEVKGTFGYLDPEYFSTRMLTKKSDVYAFGVVLWETLCGRSVIDDRIDNEQQRNLVLWVQYCCENEKVHELIDSSLRGKFPTDSLKSYIELANLCLHKESNRRPTMTQVTEDLKSLLIDGLNFLRDTPPRRIIKGMHEMYCVCCNHKRKQIILRKRLKQINN